MTAFDIEGILSQLTLEEKIGLLAGIDFWHTYAVDRLDIPSLRFSDGPNGVRGTKFFDAIPSACFPCGTALAATFDKQLLRDTGKLMGVEAKAKGAHVILGPTMNIQRGPLGGRGFESFSEDPHLSGHAAAAIVNGIQEEGIAATVKHFVCNDLEDERNSSNSILSMRALREIYLEPFRIAIKHANPKALMTGYNKVNGEHVSQSESIIKDILREEWKWEGTIMSDWYGTYTSDTAIRAGLDIEMPGPTKFRSLSEILHMVVSKELHIKHINDRVRNVLKLVQFAQGSGVPQNAPEGTSNNSAETSAKLRKIALDSIVLLKNTGILPLSKDSSIAVIGPNAKFAAYCGGGSASLASYYTTTPYSGIASKTTTPPKYSVGATGHRLLPDLASQVINPITGSVGVNAKFYSEPSTSERRNLLDEYNLIDTRVNLFDYISTSRARNEPFYIDFEGDFVPEETASYKFGLAVFGTADLYVDNKLVIDNSTNQKKDEHFVGSGTREEHGVIQLEKGKNYRIRVEFGSAHTYTFSDPNAEFHGGGSLKIGCIKVVEPEEEIRRAIEIAKTVDQVVLCIGLNLEWESEGYDRPDMELIGLQNKLVEEIIKANPNTVIVNQSGTPVEMPWLPKAKAVVQAWFGGTEGGNAIADVLFGDVNPSGKLSLSFPFKNIDNPAYLNFTTDNGRVLYGEDIFVGYRYYEKLNREVAYPFGFGLSYTSFKIGDLKVQGLDQDNIEISVNIKNTGAVDGSEVVQFYVSNDDKAVMRPIKELKWFEKVFLKAGEDKTVTSRILVKDTFSFFDEYQNQWSLQKGNYKVHVGNSSLNISQTESIYIDNQCLWTGI